MKALSALLLFLCIRVRSTSTTPLSGRLQGDSNWKLTFQRLLKDELSKLAKIQCSNSGEKATWNEYCDDVKVTVRACPRLGDEPTVGFYHSHCSVNFIYLNIDEWPDESFTSSDAIRQSLDGLFSKLPLEMCGDSLSQYCNRIESLCYRAINAAGMCISAEKLCVSPNYELFCARAGQVYLLRRALLLRLDELDNENLQHELTTSSTSSDGDKKQGSDHLWIVLVSLGCVAIICFVVAITVLVYRQRYGCRQWHKQKAPLKVEKSKPTPGDGHRKVALNFQQSRTGVFKLSSKAFGKPPVTVERAALPLIPRKVEKATHSGQASVNLPAAPSAAQQQPVDEDRNRLKSLVYQESEQNQLVPESNASYGQEDGRTRIVRPLQGTPLLYPVLTPEDEETLVKELNS